MSEYVRHILFHIEHGEFKHIQTIVDHIFVGIVLSLVWFCMEIEKTHGVYEKIRVQYVGDLKSAPIWQWTSTNRTSGPSSLEVPSS